LKAKKLSDVAKNKPASWETVRGFARALPGTEEGTSYGTPAFHVKGKFMCRLRPEIDSLVLKIDPGERDLLMQADPETFYITDHYRGYPAVLVRLSKVDAQHLRELLTHSWLFNAPPRLVEKFKSEGR
jgi:hypothetical protein